MLNTSNIYKLDAICIDKNKRDNMKYVTERLR